MKVSALITLMVIVTVNFCHAQYYTGVGATYSFEKSTSGIDNTGAYVSVGFKGKLTGLMGYAAEGTAILQRAKPAKVTSAGATFLYTVGKKFSGGVGIHLNFVLSENISTETAKFAGHGMAGVLQLAYSPTDRIQVQTRLSKFVSGSMDTFGQVGVIYLFSSQL